MTHPTPTGRCPEARRDDVSEHNATTADRYISRGGRVHGKYDRDAWATDLNCVASFLAWQDPGELRGGERADDAWTAFCRLLDLPSAELRKVIRGETP